MKRRIPFLLVLATATIAAHTSSSSGAAPMPAQQKLTTCLWFRDDAEAAVRFYTSIFAGSRVIQETRSGEGGPLPKGALVSATFELAGQRFLAINGRPPMEFNDSVSVFIDCETQREVDELWEKLTADGGEPGHCGWLKDKYGFSWQVIPRTLMELLNDKDPERARRATAAMMQMGKIDIAELERAAAGAS